MKNKKPIVIFTICFQCLFSSQETYASSFSNNSTPVNSDSQSKLKQAIAMRKSGEHNQAISILDNLRTTHVAHKRINIELALNYIKVKQYDDAENIVAHIQALNLSKKEQLTVLKLKRLLEKMLRKSLSAHSFSASLRTGLGIDIISNSFPVYVYESYQSYDDIWQEESVFDEDDIDNGSDIYNEYEYVDVDDNWYREDITNETEVSYSRQYANVSYRYRPSESFLLFSHPTQWIFNSDFSLDYRHLNQERNNNYLNAELGASLYLLQVNKWLLELSTRLSNHYNDGNTLLNKSRTRIALTLPFSQFKFKLALDHQIRNYKNQLSEFDANALMPWIEVSYLLSSDLRIVGGAKYNNLSAKDEFNSYHNRDLYLGFYYSPTHQLTAYMSYHTQRLNYKVDDPEYVNWSIEDKHSIALGLKYYFTDNINFNLSGNIGNKTIELDFGENNWKRVEASVEYRF